MSAKYDAYLQEHKRNVQLAMNWMLTHLNLTDDPAMRCKLMHRAETHDDSKYLPDEYEAYDRYFYGDNPTDPETVDAYSKAWLVHIHRNPHHWQYWMLFHDEENIIEPIEMPFEYVVEMIADWWSFSWKADRPGEIFEWAEWRLDQEEIMLHPKTKERVDSILAVLKAALMGADTDGDGVCCS